MTRPASLAADADQRISYAAASALADLLPPRERGSRDSCPLCGQDAYRGYMDHGWCYSCRTRFTPSRLLAAVWEMDRNEAAVKALALLGLAPLDAEARWDFYQREPEPDRAELAEALRTWCAGHCPDWSSRQLDTRVSQVLSACLGLLPRVRTSKDCEEWLVRTQQVMGRALDGMG